MRKSSAIFVSAIALGLAMFVPLKASAQGVSIYIGPGYPGYGLLPGYAIRLTPTIMGAIPLTVTPIQATAMAMPIQATATATAVLITALTGAKVDALRAAFIGDMNAGKKKRTNPERVGCVLRRSPGKVLDRGFQPTG